MNNNRRKQITDARIALETISSTIEEVKTDEEMAFENMPENLQYSERGENMEAHIDELDDIYSEISDLIERLETIENNELV